MLLLLNYVYWFDYNCIMFVLLFISMQWPFSTFAREIMRQKEVLDKETIIVMVM